MDISLLLDFFSQRVFLQLNATIYAIQFIAQVIYGVLRQINFDASRLKEVLSKAGLGLGDELIKRLTEQAQQGVDALADWLQAHLDELEINEVATELVVSQTSEIGQALDQAVPDEAQHSAIAQQVKAGFEDIGGAISDIADLYAEALQHSARREELVQALAERLDVWFKQTVEIRRSSLVEDIEQRAEGSLPGEQKVSVTDDSAASGIRQTIRGLDSEAKTDN